MYKAGGTFDVIEVIESKIPNLWKYLAKLPDLACSLESKLMISENPLAFACSTKEIIFSLKAFLQQTVLVFG